MKMLVTGAAGMIGYHSALRFKKLGWDVVGIDNFNDYYDVDLKLERARLLDEAGVIVHKVDVQEPEKYAELLDSDTVVLHLAAYANPRHALVDPKPYIDTNITGTWRLIQECEKKGCNVVYASSSCVMHGQPLPWNEVDRPSHQNNPYGWSKRANECQFMHSEIKRSAGLRFFTVYGPYGRPDMALFLFTNQIVKGEEVTLYNYGDMKRDFTYVDDIVDGIVLVVDKVVSDTDSYHEIYNIGYGDQVDLLDFLDHIETNLGRKAKRKLAPKHRADVPATWSDTTKLQQLGYKPTTPINVGVKKFVDWYKEYYNVV